MNETMDYLKAHGVVVVFLTVLVEQLGVPLPAAPILMLGGSLAATGSGSLSLVLAMAVLACLVADTLWFYLGRHKGGSVLGFLCRISMEPDSCVRKTRNLFTRYGVWGLLLAKFVPGLSTIAPPLAGMSGTRYGIFLLADGLGSVLYTGVFVLLGRFFSNQIGQITEAVAGLGVNALILLGALLAAYLGFKQWQRQKVLQELRMARITVAELRKLQTDGEPVLVVDLRPAGELGVERYKIPGALHLTLEEIEERHREIPRDRLVVIYCSCPNEASSAKMAYLLHRKGVTQVRPLLGGIDAWREQDFPVENHVPAGI